VIQITGLRCGTSGSVRQHTEVIKQTAKSLKEDAVPFAAYRPPMKMLGKGSI